MCQCVHFKREGRKHKNKNWPVHSGNCSFPLLMSAGYSPDSKLDTDHNIGDVCLRHTGRSGL